MISFRGKFKENPVLLFLLEGDCLIFSNVFIVSSSIFVLLRSELNGSFDFNEGSCKGLGRGFLKIIEGTFLI